MQNKSYYLYNGQNYWTLSPYYFNGSTARVFELDSIGNLNGLNVHSTGCVRPVINLRSDVKLTFTGTGEKGSITNPYVVKD